MELGVVISMPEITTNISICRTILDDMDLLAETLAVGGVRGTAGARIEASGPWGILWHGIAGAAFYAVTCGTA
jgi:hypothetical protein